MIKLYISFRIIPIHEISSITTTSYYSTITRSFFNMPTATEYFGISVSNIGPLTTTYTPPPECTRATTDHLVYALESSLVYGFGSPDCVIDPYGKCLPSGAAMDSIIKEYSYPKSGQGIHAFHSPGIHCPEGWTTAGLLAHGDKTGSAYRSGVFTSTTSVNSSHPLQMGSDEWWLRVLEPSETLAWCCPRYVDLSDSLLYCTLTHRSQRLGFSPLRILQVLHCPRSFSWLQQRLL